MLASIFIAHIWLTASAETVTGYLCRTEADAERVLAAEAADAKSGERTQDAVGHELLASGACAFFADIQLVVVSRGKRDIIEKRTPAQVTGYAREAGGKPELFGVVELPQERGI